MKNKLLIGIFLGMAFMLPLIYVNNWTHMLRWQSEAVDHGAGYYAFYCYDKLDWMGHQPMTFRWKDEPMPAHANPPKQVPNFKRGWEARHPKQNFPKVEIPTEKKNQLIDI